MLERLNQLVDDIQNLNSKLILLIGAPGSGKTRLLEELGRQRQVTVSKVGSSLGRQLLAIPGAQRHLRAATLLSALAADHSRDGLVIFDNIELLFDQDLQLDPLDLLKRTGRSRRIVAAWPGELNNNRLTYAMIGHPERQDYAVDGLVPFEIN
jgi:hypothetical protein